MSQTPNQALANDGINFTPTIHHDTYPFIDPMNSPSVPLGRSVFITGASRGIGRATALSYARAGFTHIGIGARSSLADLTREIQAASTAAGHTTTPVILALKVDVTSQKSMSAAATAVGDTFGGKLDVLVANAGYLEAFTPAMAMNPDEWWRTYEVNVLGTFLTYRYFAPLVLASELRTVLLLSSIAAHKIAPVGGTAYVGSKLVLLRFAEHIAVEEQGRGLIAFSVHPGGVRTELAKGMGEEIGKVVLIDTPELAADSIVWLTRERREWLAGRYVSTTWDMEEFERKRQDVEDGDLLKVRMAVRVGN